MIERSDLTIERIRGTGPGGQHRNKTASCVRVTHNPTGISVCIDGRNQHQNLRVALKELEDRLEEARHGAVAEAKKARRDHAIHNEETVRHYDFKRGVVKDLRTGKQASIKDVLVKGNIDLVAPRDTEVRGLSRE